MRKGGVVVHHGATLHASVANTSDRWRRGYALHFGAFDGLEFDSEKRALRTEAYCVQEWYPDRATATVRAKPLV